MKSFVWALEDSCKKTLFLCCYRMLVLGLCLTDCWQAGRSRKQAHFLRSLGLFWLGMCTGSADCLSRSRIMNYSREGKGR